MTLDCHFFDSETLYTVYMIYVCDDKEFIYTNSDKKLPLFSALCCTRRNSSKAFLSAPTTFQIYLEKKVDVKCAMTQEEWIVFGWINLWLLLDVIRGNKSSWDWLAYEIHTVLMRKATTLEVKCTSSSSLLTL